MKTAVGFVLLLTATNALGFSFSWPWSRPSKPDSVAPPTWTDLRVHFSPLGPAGGFFALPRTAAAAKAEGYVTPPEETADDVTVLCADKDPSICVLFDKQGNVAGMDISIKQSDGASSYYPFEQHPSFVPKKRFGYDVYVSRLFFVEQNVLSTGGRKSLDTAGTGTGLWLQDGSDREKLFEVPRLDVDIAKTAYTKENCVPGMGVHYYYNISESLKCEDFMPIFALYRGEEMIGFGYQTFGKVTPIKKVWFEAIPSFAIKPTIPNAPQCLVESANSYGIISLHVYFVENPWAIVCTGFQSAV